MACGCSKKKTSQTVNQARTARVLYRPTPIAEGLAPTHALEGTRFRSVRYLVAPKEDLAAGNLESAEVYNVLAEAQKRIRDLGPGYGVKATRD